MKTLLFAVWIILAAEIGEQPPVVSEHHLHFESLPAELENKTAALISDTHIGATLDVKWLNERVDQILELKPDIVFIAGDVFEGWEETELDMDPVPVLKRLTSVPLGAWAVMGNHDYYGENNRSAEHMENAGIRLLRNECQTVLPGLSIAGVEDLTLYRRRGGGETAVHDTLTACEEDFIIYLSHTPDQYEEAADLGADLMLAGHTHGGQVWPLDFLVAVAYSLVEGEYKIGDMTAFVTRGAGHWGLGVRLWEPGEIVHFTFHRAQSESPTHMTSR